MSRRLHLDLDALRRKYDAGDTMVSIAKDFGVSATVIGSRLREMGVEARRRGSGLSEELTVDVSELRGLYEKDDLTIREIATRFNVTYGLVWSRLRSAGVQMKNGHRANERLTRELKSLQQAGTTLDEIAEAYGMTTQAVAERLNGDFHRRAKRASAPAPKTPKAPDTVSRLLSSKWR